MRDGGHRYAAQVEASTEDILAATGDGEGQSEIGDGKMSVETKVLDVVPGKRYRFHLGGCYSPVGIARDAHTLRRVVVYRGLDGEDRGELFCCPMLDWSLKFLPVGDDDASRRAGFPIVSGRASSMAGKEVGAFHRGARGGEI